MYQIIAKLSVLFSVILLSLALGNSAFAKKTPSKMALSYAKDSPDLKWLSCPDFLPCTFTVLNGELGGNNMDVFLKIAGKTSIPFHTHTSSERMIIVAGEFHSTYAGQERVKLKTGDYAYGPANAPHDGYCASTEPCVLFIAYDTPLDAKPFED